MQKAMLQCNGVQTQIITEGRWVEEEIAEDGNKHVVLIIPGNPGIPEFYEGFIKSLATKLPSQTPIWVIGHAGHVQPPNDLAVAMPSDENYYNMDAQLKHKAEFIKKYIPKDAKVHLVGHSIGCWFILQLLKDDMICDRVIKTYLLFPTIERMAESPCGKFFTNIIERLIPIILFLASIFMFFPLFLQILLIRIFGLFYGIPKKSINAVHQMLNPIALKRILYMAKEEMRRVKEIDHAIISKHVKKLWFYYGSIDNWTPISYYEDMKTSHPTVQAELCKRGFYHSFVLKNDKEMGYVVGDLINEVITSTSIQ